MGAREDEGEILEDGEVGGGGSEGRTVNAGAFQHRRHAWPARQGGRPPGGLKEGGGGGGIQPEISKNLPIMMEDGKMKAQNDGFPQQASPRNKLEEVKRPSPHDSMLGNLSFASSGSTEGLPVSTSVEGSGRKAAAGAHSAFQSELRRESNGTQKTAVISSSLGATEVDTLSGPTKNSETYFKSAPGSYSSKAGKWQGIENASGKDENGNRGFYKPMHIERNTEVSLISAGNGRGGKEWRGNNFSSIRRPKYFKQNYDNFRRSGEEHLQPSDRLDRGRRYRRELSASPNRDRQGNWKARKSSQNYLKSSRPGREIRRSGEYLRTPYRRGSSNNERSHGGRYRGIDYGFRGSRKPKRSRSRSSSRSSTRRSRSRSLSRSASRSRSRGRTGGSRYSRSASRSRSISDSSSGSCSISRSRSRSRSPGHVRGRRSRSPARYASRSRSPRHRKGRAERNLMPRKRDERQRSSAPHGKTYSRSRSESQDRGVSRSPIRTGYLFESGRNGRRIYGEGPGTKGRPYEKMSKENSSSAHSSLEDKKPNGLENSKTVDAVDEAVGTSDHSASRDELRLESADSKFNTQNLSIENRVALENEADPAMKTAATPNTLLGEKENESLKENVIAVEKSAVLDNSEKGSTDESRPESNATAGFSVAAKNNDAFPNGIVQLPQVVSANSAGEDLKKNGMELTSVYGKQQLLFEREEEDMSVDSSNDDMDMDVEDEPIEQNVIPGVLKNTPDVPQYSLRKLTASLPSGESFGYVSHLRGDPWRLLTKEDQAAFPTLPQGVRHWSVRGFIDRTIPALSHERISRKDPRRRDFEVPKKQLGVISSYREDENDPTDDERVLILSNLNNNATEQFLELEFASYGKILRIKVYRHKGAHAGFAHIIYKTREGASRALAAVSGTNLLGKALGIETDPMFKKATQQVEALQKRDEEDAEARRKQQEEEEERKRALELKKEAERIRKIEEGEQRRKQQEEEKERKRKEELEQKNASNLKPPLPSSESHPPKQERSPILPALRVAMLPASITAGQIRLHFVNYGCIYVKNHGPFWMVLFATPAERDFAFEYITSAQEPSESSIMNSRFQLFLHSYNLSRAEQVEILGESLTPPTNEQELVEEICAMVRRTVRDAAMREVRHTMESEAVSSVYKIMPESRDVSVVKPSSISAVLKHLPSSVGFQHILKPHRPHSHRKPILEENRDANRDADRDADRDGESEAVREKQVAKAEGPAQKTERSSRRKRRLLRMSERADEDSQPKKEDEQMSVEPTPLFEEKMNEADTLHETDTVSQDTSEATVPKPTEELREQELKEELKETVSDVSVLMSGESEVDEFEPELKKPKVEEKPLNPTGCARSEPYRKLDDRLKNKWLESDQPQPPTKVMPSKEDKVAPLEKRVHVRRVRRGAGPHCEPSSILTKKTLKTQRKNIRAGKSRIHGFGLYVQENVDAGEYVVEYIGEILRNSVADSREKMYQRKGRGDSYMFRVSENAVVDATMNGYLSRYVNHSCEPNVDARIIEVEREKKIVFYSKRALSAGEEITYDYKFELEDDQEKIPCLCQAKTCRIYLN